MALDPVLNPYTPGAGQRPAVLSGRDAELLDFTARLQRLERGRSAQCTLIVGLRGVGKTVLLNRFAQEAVRRDWVVVEHELSVSGDLMATLARLVREALFAVSPPSAWKRAARRVAGLLAGIEVTYRVAGLSVRLGDSAEGEPDSGVSGDPARDLTDLLVALGEHGQEQGRGVLLSLDELQFAPIEPLGALVAGLHKVAQRELPVTVVAAGLPQTRGVLAEAASYSERMFETRSVDALSREDAFLAIGKPAADENVLVEDAALEEAYRFSEGYPFFLQVFGDHLWRIAHDQSITHSDASAAGPQVREWLDRGFFTFRTDKLTAVQRRYLRAMAEVPGDEASSGDIAAVLGLKSSAHIGQTRESLIRRGLIFSPRLGYASFSVPQFGDYLRRHFELERHTPRSRGAGT